MKKLPFLLFIGLCTNLCAQELVPYRVNTKWGYSDPVGKIIVEPKYDKADFFSSSGFANVSLGGQQTLLDKTGKEVMPFQYTAIFTFESGLSAVCKGGERSVMQGEIVGGSWGFINEKFEEVIPCQFSRVDNFKGDFAIVQTEGNWGAWGVINKEGKVIVPFNTKSYSFDMRPFPGLSWDTKPGVLRKDISGRGGRWQLIDLTGKPIGKPYNAMHGDRDLYSAPATKTPSAPTGKISVLDQLGHPVMLNAAECKFQYLTGANFLLKVPFDTSDPAYKYAIISGTTTLVRLGEYRYINDDCSEGLVRVFNDDRGGYVDCLSGKEIVSPRYSYTKEFKNGYAFVAYNYLSHNWNGHGMINRTGLEFFKDDPAVHIVTFNDQYLLLDEHNYKIEPPWFKGSTIRNIKGNTVMYTNARGKASVAQFSTSNIYVYNRWEDYCCPLYRDNKTYTGIDTLDTRIHQVIKFSSEYDSVYFHQSNDSILVVLKSGKMGILNLQGKEMVPPLYDDVVPFSTKSGVHFTVTNDNLSGIVDATGKIILPVNYGISFETPGYQVVSKSESDLMGLVKDGSKIILPAEYGQIDPYMERDADQMITNIVFLAYKVERPVIVDSEGVIVFSDKTVSIETLDTEATPGIYFEISKRKKRGIFKVGSGVIIPMTYDYIEPATADGKRYFMVKLKKKYGLTDDSGKIIVPVNYKLIEPIDEADNLFILYGNNSKDFYLTKENQIVEKKDE